MNIIQYCEPEAAREIIGNRRVDDKLSARLRDLTRDDLPDGPFGDLADGVIPSVRAEYLARPTCGDIDYMQSARESDFDPWTLTYEMDQYLDSNPKKAKMVRPILALPKNQIVRLRIVETIKRYNGYPIGSIPTNLGVSLAGLWCALRKYELSRANANREKGNVYDISSWYNSQAVNNGWDIRKPSKAGYYYTSLMALYTARAVLFCDFSAFPSFKYAESAVTAVQEKLGVEPVIVKWRPKPQYPSSADENRYIDEAAVDLSDRNDLCFDNLKGWLSKEVLCVDCQE